MKLNFMLLGRNKNTNENNENDTWEEIFIKLEEEYLELKEAITEGDRVHIAEESFDLVQITIRIIRKLAKEGYNIEQLNARHNKKLVKRGWESLKIIKIFIK